MKIRFLLFILVIISFNSSGQITFDQHEIELNIHVKDLNRVKDINAKSTCGEVSISLDEKLFSGGCAGVLVREYTAKDACGNTSTTTCFLHLIDDEPPVFQDITSSTSEYVSVNDMNEIKIPSVKDDHPGSPKITYTDVVNDEFVIRQWKASDLCGNSSEVVIRYKLIKVN